MQICLDSQSPQQTFVMAGRLAGLLQAGDTIVLSGTLGAGKTYFAKALLHILCPDQLVRSPTFSIVNVYQAAAFPVYHADFYRLQSEEELWAAGWEDYIDGDGLLLIEWGERFPAALPTDYLQIELCPIDVERRRFILRSQGERGKDLMEGWSHALAGS